MLLLFASFKGAIAGDWAIAGDGCKVLNPHPTPGETIRWTGGCKDGFVEGMGALEWQRGGKTYERDEGQWVGGRQISGSQVWPGGQMMASSQTASRMGAASLSLAMPDMRGCL